LFKIGLIGNGTHSKRIQKILKKKKFNYYIYKPNNPNYYNKKDFIKLLDCQAVFILTPNNTHLKYIHELSKKNLYIFCEKPPVSSLEGYNNLIKVNQNKIYYNFNFRFSKLSEIFSSIKKYNFGNFLYGSLIIGHGLAFKKGFKDSWRSNKKKIPNGVFEIVGIHWIDFINYHLNIKGLTKVNNSHKKINNSIDSSYITIRTKNNKIINIFCSYVSPLIDEKIFIFENGYICQKSENIEIRGPTMSFDKNNMFKKPPLIKRFKYNDRKDYDLGLEKSVDYFLNRVKKKKFFKKKETKKSLESNYFLF